MAARKHEWLVGRKIRLGRDMETRGGTKFPKGIVCLVTSVYRGDLYLKARNPDPLNIFGPKYISMHSDLDYRMEVLPDDRPRCPWRCGHLSKSHAEKTEGCDQGRCECAWFPGTTETDPDLDSENEMLELDEAYLRSGRKNDRPTKSERTPKEDLAPEED